MSEVVTLPQLKRIEGHGRVSLFVGDDGTVNDAHFDVVEFRGFEKMVEGRMVWEMPLVTSRVCGICPVSHHVAAVKAVDALFGVEPPRAGKLLRELLHLAGFVHDHALHFFFLAGPDFLTGEGLSRDLLGVAKAHPEAARKAIALRRRGQHIVETVGGQGHPVTAIPGGMSRGVSTADRVEMLDHVRAALEDALDAERMAKDSTLRLMAENPGFASQEMPYMATMGTGRTLELYDGLITAANADGSQLAEFPIADYEQHIDERVLPNSYAKAPYLKALGPDAGPYRVGPLARINLSEKTAGDRSQALLEEFRAELGRPVHASLAYHWARMIELVAVLERMSTILSDEETSSPDVRVKVERKGGVGVGAVEAPRGTLIHHYEADPVGRVTSARLIVATTQNNIAIDRAVLDAVRGVKVDGGEPDKATQLKMELGIRAYDPCLSCATHEVGAMPFSFDVVREEGHRW